MNAGDILTWTIIGLNAVAAIAYAVQGDPRQAVYYVAGAVLVFAAVGWPR